MVHSPFPVRNVRHWEISNTLDSDFCIRAWERALRAGRRATDIANTDQGSQLTSEAYLEAVEAVEVSVSMNGRGRWMDNRMIERLWRSVKYQDIYLRDYLDALELGRGLSRRFVDYNQTRPPQSLVYATPGHVYGDPGAHGAPPKMR